MTANFRYTSSWKKFEESLKILKKLISQNQAYWMIGYMRDLDIYIDEQAEESLEEDVLDIIRNEILYLLYVLLEKEDIEEDGIKEALAEIEDEPEEEIQKVATSVRQCHLDNCKVMTIIYQFS